MSHDRTQPPRSGEQPTRGYYKIKRGERWLPAEIVCNHGLWSVFVAGQPTAAEGFAEPWHAPSIEWVAFSPRITAAEHAAMMAELHPDAPREPISLGSAPPLY